MCDDVCMTAYRVISLSLVNVCGAGLGITLKHGELFCVIAFLLWCSVLFLWFFICYVNILFFFTHLRTKIKFHLGIAPGLWDFQNQY